MTGMNLNMKPKEKKISINEQFEYNGPLKKMDV